MTGFNTNKLTNTTLHLTLVKRSWVSVARIAQSVILVVVVLKDRWEGLEDWRGVPDHTLVCGQQEAGGPEVRRALRQGLGHWVEVGAGGDVADSLCVGDNSVLY